MHSTLLQILPPLLILIVLGSLFRQGKLSAEETGLRRPSRGAAWIVLLYVAISLAQELWSYKTGLLAAEVSPWHYSPAVTVLRVVGAVVLAPCAEEVVFRGLIYFHLARRLSPALAVLIQAVLFAAAHSLAVGQSRTPIFDISQHLLYGCLYGLARWRSRSIYPSIGMHAFGNAIAVLERLVL